MASGIESITVEKVWDDVEPFVVYKIPSAYKGKVLMVYENLHDVSVRVVTEEEYKGCIENLLYAERPRPIGNSELGERFLDYAVKEPEEEQTDDQGS